jgi:hypothetical protein
MHDLRKCSTAHMSSDVDRAEMPSKGGRRCQVRAYRLGLREYCFVATLEMMAQPAEYWQSLKIAQLCRSRNRAVCFNAVKAQRQW